MIMWPSVLVLNEYICTLSITINPACECLLPKEKSIGVLRYGSFLIPPNLMRKSLTLFLYIIN